MADKEQRDISILLPYLPKQLSSDELEAMAKEVSWRLASPRPVHARCSSPRHKMSRPGGAQG